MLLRYPRKVFLAALLFGAVPTALFALKSNDFTKANSNFSRKYETSSSSFDGLRARDADKKFSTKPYSYEDHAAQLIDKEAALIRNDNLGDMNQRRDYRSGKLYDSIPDYSRHNERWRKDGLKLPNENLSRDMGKEYRGRFVDKSLKTQFSTEEIRNNYDEMLERSIGDINKYQYGASRQSAEESRGPIPVVKAGGQRDGGESGIFDFLKSDTNIERPAVSFKGAVKSSKAPTPENQNVSIVEPISGQDSAKPSAGPPPASVTASTPRIPAYSAGTETPAIERSNSSESVRIDPKTGERRVLKSVTEVDSNLDILSNVPKSWRTGKPQIKIEVNE